MRFASFLKGIHSKPVAKTRPNASAKAWILIGALNCVAVYRVRRISRKLNLKTGNFGGGLRKSSRTFSNSVVFGALILF